MSDNANEDARILATLTASAPRRGLAVTVLGLLTVMLIWLAGVTPAELPWKLVLLCFGLAAGWATLSMWRATAVGLLLTEEGIVQTDGRVVAEMEQIVSVDRSVFAMKPSNGFTVRLAARHSVSWAPGLWWRYGRRLGVGGVTSASQAKQMADILAIYLSDPTLGRS